MAVTQDFIPVSANLTETERELLHARKQRAKGQGFKDFIPVLGHVRKPPSGSAAQHKEALERAMARQSSAAREDYDNAVEKLKNLNVSQAIEAIRKAPYSVMEMTLVAEKENGNRKSILQAFPEVDPDVVARWKEIMAGAPAQVASPAVVSSTAGDAEE